jgi:hypothetical protein
MGIYLFDARSAIAGLNTCVNTWHVAGSNVNPTTADGNTILAPFKTFYDAHAAYRTNATSFTIGSRMLWFLESWWVKPVIDPITHKVTTRGYFTTEPVIVGATALSSTTGSGGAGLPPQLASVVSWRSTVSGRSGRGRTYLGNLAASAMSGATVAAAAVTAVNNASTALITAVNGLAPPSGPCHMAVWSPTKGVAREIISGAMDSTFDTMRSRVK